MSRQAILNCMAAVTNSSLPANKAQALCICFCRGGVVYIHLKKATDLDRKSFLKSAGLKPHL